MQLTAPKLIAGIISAIWGFASLIGAPSALSEQPNPVPVARDYLIEPTTTTSSTIYIDPYTTACEQFSALAVNLGWPADQRTVLESIMKRESNCTPNAVNRKDPFGGSRGLLQINGSWHKWLISKGVMTRKQDLLQAQTNLLAGLEIYNYGVERYGFGWGPWSVK
jgi:soluble lytic murein transglycosylase-like protein